MEVAPCWAARQRAGRLDAVLPLGAGRLQAERRGLVFRLAATLVVPPHPLDALQEKPVLADALIHAAPTALPPRVQARRPLIERLGQLAPASAARSPGDPPPELAPRDLEWHGKTANWDRLVPAASHAPPPGLLPR